MSDVSHVTAAKPAAAGAIRVAPYGTTLPTDAKTALSDAWKTLGYISEDGYTNTNGPESSQTKAWGGDTVLSGETAKADTFKTKFIEYFNADLLKAIYGDDNIIISSTTGMITIHANNAEQVAKSWCITEIMKNGKISRTLIANGTITSISEIPHKDGEPIYFEVVITAMPDEAHQVTKDGNTYNDTHITYIE